MSLAALAGGVVDTFRVNVARLNQLPPWNIDLKPGEKVSLELAGGGRRLRCHSRCLWFEISVSLCQWVRNVIDLRPVGLELRSVGSSGLRFSNIVFPRETSMQHFCMMPFCCMPLLWTRPITKDRKCPVGRVWFRTWRARSSQVQTAE